MPERQVLTNKFDFLKKFKYFNLESSFEEVLEYVKKYKVFSFDFETAGLYELEPITISFCVKSDDGVYYGFVVDFRDFYLSGKEYKEKIKIFFKIFDEAHLIIAHNISFDLKVLSSLGYDIQFLRYKIYDTMLAVYVNNTESEKSLKDITKTYFGNNIKYQEVDFISALKTGVVKEIKDFSIKFKSYNLQDSLLAMMLYEKTYWLIERNHTILALFLETQIAFLGIEMFERGIYIDADLLSKLKKDYEKQVLELEDELKNIARSKYNYDLDLRSSLSIKEFFKKHLIKNIKNIPKDLLTPKGDISLSIENLDFLGIEDKEFQEKYILYKETRKILESYGIDNLLVNRAEGRVIPNINTSGTKTMRMIITDPPLQTIPANAVGKKIRKCFRGSGNNKLLVADLSQLELRILAFYIDREELIEKYNQGIDFHSQTAEKLGIDRKMAKVVNFMVVYGGGAKSLAKKLRISEKEAKKLIDNFSKTLSGYLDLKNYVVGFIKKNGYVQLPYFVRRYLDRNDPRSERVAFNSLIQMTASIFVKTGMYLLWEIFGEDLNLVLQIHDEIIVEDDEKYLKFLSKYIKIIYEKMFIFNLGKDAYDGKQIYAIGQNLKFKIEPEVGEDWLEAKK